MPYTRWYAPARACNRLTCPRTAAVSARALPLAPCCFPLTAYKGKLHPLKGDAPNKAVRDAASAALKAVFDSDAGVPQLGAAMKSVGPGIGGGGGSASTAGGSAFQRQTWTSGATAHHTGGSSSAMPAGATYQSTTASGLAGIGSHAPPTASDPREKAAAAMKSAFSAVKTAFQNATTPAQQHQAPVPGSDRPHSSGFTFASNRGPNAVSSGTYKAPDTGAPATTYGGVSPASGSGATPHSGSGAPRAAGSVGGGWGAPPVSGTPGSAGQAGGAWGAGSGSAPAAGVPASTKPDTSSYGRAGVAASDGAYERRLVENITGSGGLKPVPDPAELRTFMAAALSLDAQLLSDLLDERLQSDTWQTVMKSLAVIEALAKSPGHEATARHLADNCDVILDLHDEHPRPAVRKAATAALAALGVDYAGALAQNGSAPAPAPAGASHPADDLLGDLGFGTAAPAPAPTTGGDLDDLMAGMTLSPATAPAPAPASSGMDMFSGMSPAPAQVPAPAPAPAPASGDAFSDLMSGLSPARAATPAPAPAPAAAGFSFTASSGTPAASGPSTGFAFTSASPSQATAPTPAQASPMDDLLGGMVSGITFTSPTPAPAPAPAPATGGDSFSFIAAEMAK